MNRQQTLFVPKRSHVIQFDLIAILGGRRKRWDAGVGSAVSLFALCVVVALSVLAGKCSVGENRV